MYVKIIKTIALTLGLSSMAWAQNQLDYTPNSAQSSQQSRDEPIHIESDRLVIDEASGSSTYKGNVVFSQGNNQLWADELIIKSEDRESLDRIVAVGQPARFQFVAENPDDNTEGQAQRLIYKHSTGILILEGEAILHQGSNNFSSNRIQYNSNTRTVTAGKAGGDQADEGRVKVVIQPKPKTDTEQ